MNFSDEDIYEQIMASLINFFGKQATALVQKQMSTIKLKDTFYTSGYKNRGSSRGSYRGNQNRGFYNKGYQGNRGGRGSGFTANAT